MESMRCSNLLMRIVHIAHFLKTDIIFLAQFCLVAVWSRDAIVIGLKIQYNELMS